MKVCFKCKEEKSLSDFYRHPQMADGHLNKCKECNKKDTKDNIAKNHEYYREYDKRRANLPHRVMARNNYAKTDNYKKSSLASSKKWMMLNPLKRKANTMVGNAIRDGTLIKPCSCSECHADGVRIHGHHDDYAYPLSVRWLCSKCHRLWHKENDSAINGLTNTQPATAGFSLLTG